MKNDRSRPTRLEWLADNLENAWGKFGFFAVASYGIALVTRDQFYLQASLTTAGIFYALMTPAAAVIVATRKPPGDYWRASAAMAYGATPWLLLFTMPQVLKTFTGLALVTATIYAWNIFAVVKALRTNPPLRTPAVRSVVMGGAALIYLACAVVLIGVGALGLFIGAFEPHLAWVTGPLGILVGVCPGLLAAWASLRLAVCARDAWRAR
jgi:hypothetical protein